MIRQSLANRRLFAAGHVHDKLDKRIRRSLYFEPSGSPSEIEFARHD